MQYTDYKYNNKKNNVSNAIDYNNRHFFLRKIIIFTAICLFAGNQLYSQIELDSLYEQLNTVLSISDEARLQACPILKMTDEQRNRPLPSAVDNSRNSFMSPIFSQTSLECGQASSICYTLTYELNCRRNLVNDNISKRYPSHFVWNFCNQGTNRGVSFMDTWEVIRTAGTPNVTQWGGSYATGGYARWISGYESYYAAMHNRIVEMYAIPTDSPDGILTLRQWLHNHLRGDEYGGLVNFYSTHVPQGHEMQAFLPEGTPCAGMYVVPAFTSNVNHAQTIVGYNDSIRWDYNNDGRYTNDVDINGDGVIDVRDWEIGGVIFCNSFGSGFSDGGYCFLPYKKLSELPATGGIWNSCVYLVNVKDEVYPQITYKATIEHTSRMKLKLTAGVASNAAATEPEHTLEFNVFNFQGGEHYMQGDSTDEQKQLELGLDVSPLLNYITPNSPTKFFFNVTENDPDAISDGQIINFSLMDYTGGIVAEQTCTQSNTPIANNAVTTLSVTRAINFSKPVIDATTPRTLEAYSDYRYEIPVSGGKAPYRWEFTKEYNIEEFTASYPTTAGNNVLLPNNDNGYATVDIPFDFPFYGEKFNRLLIMADGYLAFRYDTYNWPFLQSTDLQLKTTKLIAPLKANLIVSSVKLNSSDQEMTIMVTAKFSGQNNSNISYTVKLFPNGVIEYYYGNMDFSGSNFLSVISRGDGRIFQKTSVSGVTADLLSNRNFRFTPPASIDFLTLSSDGILSGMSTTAFTGLPVAVTCFDNNDVRDDTVLMLNCDFTNRLIITNIEVNAGDDNQISAGEEVDLSITIKNLDSEPYNDCNLSFSIVNENVTMIDSTEYFGYIAPENEYTLNHAIRFSVDENTPHLSILDFNTRIDNDRFPVSDMRSFTVYSHLIEVSGYFLTDDNNCLPDGNETDTLIVFLKNNGDELVTNLDFQLHFQEPEITMIEANGSIDSLNAGEQKSISFSFHLSPNFVSGTTIDAFMDIFVDSHFFQSSIMSIIGEGSCKTMENGLPEEFWVADTAWIPSDVAHTGRFSLGSGLITHNETSTVNYPVTISHDGNVTFYHKVSSEAQYDFLKFFIDDSLQERWSGNFDWTLSSYPITAGEHMLTWKYVKDYSVNNGSDRAWIDDVCLPPANDETPEIDVSPEVIDLEVYNEISTFPVTLQSITPIYLLFANHILDENNDAVGWISTDYPNGSLNALASKTVNLQIDARNMLLDIYHLKLVTTAINGNTITTPITITVLSNDINDYESANWGMKVYPNPTQNQVRIEIDDDSYYKDIHYELYDMFGKQLRSFDSADKELIINLQEYSNGIYILRAVAENKEMKVVKIIKK